ncbi:MAG: 23S rRNA (uracil(1939)-C(5))-methyltransferase RlmD [Bacteroidales bacterium]|nr:23S rRNA (uracil(1939)-C(5))-methyltransferase RlmD [Bacteroidales bacterium]
MRNKPTIILENIVIEAVAAEGKSLAHAKLPAEPEETTPRVLFVPFAVPGDVVNVMVTKRKKSFLEGRIERIVKPSPRRLEPFCKHFGTCGGCKWQILPYDLQLEAKRQQVYDQLVRIGHLDVPEIRPVLGSAKTIEYRNKLEFTASEKRWVFADEDPEKLTDEERVGLGFHVGKFFDKVLDIEHCYLQREPSNQIRLFVKKYALEHGISFYNLREKTGILRNMFVRTAENQQVMLIVCFAHEFPERRAFLDAIAEEFPEISSLYYLINEKVNDSVTDQECILYKGDEAIYESMEGLSFKIGPKSFYQTNTEQAYELYKVARDFADLSGSEVVYDLYTGTGTIAQFVSAKASKVIGIEYVPEAIADARENARRNGIDNCEFFAGDMKDILTDGFIAEHGRPDVIILDPPRAGIHPDVAKVILNAAPGRIVYVSCNPASQARDLAALSVKYKVTAVQPVDMFPHTQHVENVCRLELL